MGWFKFVRDKWNQDDIEERYEKIIDSAFSIEKAIADGTIDDITVSLEELFDD